VTILLTCDWLTISAQRNATPKKFYNSGPAFDS